MKRRIVEQGGLTLMVSLPRSWAKRHNLKKGDEIDLVQVGDNLVVSTGYQPKQTKKKIYVKSKKEFMLRLIHAPYRQGYDELEIKFEDPEILPLIKNKVDQLLGFEIVEEGKNYVIIQMVAKGMEEEFDKIINRLLLMGNNSLNELTEAVKNKKDIRLDELIEMEKTNNKLTAFCERLLNTKGYAEFKKTNFFYILIWTLEQIGDDIRDLAKVLKKTDLAKLSNVKIPLEKTAKLSELFNKLYSKMDMPNSVVFKEGYEDLENSIDKTKTQNKEEMEIIFYLKSIAGKLKDLTLSMV